MFAHLNLSMKCGVLVQRMLRSSGNIFVGSKYSTISFYTLDPDLLDESKLVVLGDPGSTTMQGHAFRGWLSALLDAIITRSQGGHSQVCDPDGQWRHQAL